MSLISFVKTLVTLRHLNVHSRIFHLQKKLQDINMKGKERGTHGEN